MTSFGNLSLFTGAAYAATWPMLLFLASSIFFSNSSFCFSCAHSNCSCLTLSRPALLISLLPNLLYNWFERVFAINTWFPRQPLLVVPQIQRSILLARQLEPHFPISLAWSVFLRFDPLHNRSKSITMSFDSFSVCFLHNSLSFPLSKHRKFKLHVQLRGQRLHCCLVIVLASGLFPLLCFVSLTVPSEVPVWVRNLPIASNTTDQQTGITSQFNV